MQINEIIEACQTKVGVAADGQPGPITWAALYTRLLGEAPPANTPLGDLIIACQNTVAVTADGQAGPATWTAIYTKLFGQAPAPAQYTELADGNHNDDPWPPPAGFPAFIHKATQGTGFNDPKGVARRAQFKASGGLWGWYHFTSGADPTAQANHFLSYIAAAGHQADDLICLDFENSDPPGRNMTSAEAETWIQIVEAALGCKVCVYGSNLLTDALQEHPARFANQPLWPARYSNSPPQLPGGRNWALWQYTDHGHPYGDMDRFLGTEADLRAMWPNLPV